MDEICNTVQEAVTKTIPKEKRFKKSKLLSEKTLQIAVKEEKQNAREKGNDIPN